jgi:fucose permease
MKKMPAVIALMAVFTLAICFSVVGSFSEEMKKAQEFGNADLGSLVFALFLTACIVQFFIGPLVDKVGYKPVAIIGFAVICGSMFLFAFARGISQALVAAIMLGVGAMCVNTVGNTLMPVVLFEGKDPARASNFGNGFFGLGLVLTPLLPVFVVNILGKSYSTGFVILGALTLLFLLLAVMTSFPRVATGFQFSMAFKLLGKGPVLIAALALLCYISLESTMNTWIKPLMTEMYTKTQNPNAVRNAGLVLSLFGVSMMLGRFLTSTIKNLTQMGERLITMMTIVAINAVILLIITGNPLFAIIEVFLVGLAFAPIFPTIVGVTFSKFEPRLYGSIFGIIFAIGLLGGTFVPKLIGNLSKKLTIQGSMPVAVIMALILLMVSMFLGRNQTAEKK